MLRSPHAHARIVSDRRAARRRRCPASSPSSPAPRPRRCPGPSARSSPPPPRCPTTASRWTARATSASRWPRWPRWIAPPPRTRSSASRSSTSRCPPSSIPEAAIEPECAAPLSGARHQRRLARHAHLRRRGRRDGARGRRAARALHHPALRLDAARDLRRHRGVRRRHRRLRRSGRTTSGPGLTIAILAGALGVPQSRIRLSCPDIGGGFGNKRRPAYLVICALLARKAGRPGEVDRGPHREPHRADARLQRRHGRGAGVPRPTARVLALSRARRHRRGQEPRHARRSTTSSSSATSPTATASPPSATRPGRCSPTSARAAPTAASASRSCASPSSARWRCSPGGSASIPPSCACATTCTAERDAVHDAARRAVRQRRLPGDAAARARALRLRGLARRAGARARGRPPARHRHRDLGRAGGDQPRVLRAHHRPARAPRARRRRRWCAWSRTARCARRSATRPSGQGYETVIAQIVADELGLTPGRTSRSPAASTRRPRRGSTCPATTRTSSPSPTRAPSSAPPARVRDKLLPHRRAPAGDRPPPTSSCATAPRVVRGRARSAARASPSSRAPPTPTCSACRRARSRASRRATRTRIRSPRPSTPSAACARSSSSPTPRTAAWWRWTRAPATCSILKYVVVHDCGRELQPAHRGGHGARLDGARHRRGAARGVPLRRGGPAPDLHLHGLSEAHGSRRARHRGGPPRASLAVHAARRQGRRRGRRHPRPRRRRQCRRGRAGPVRRGHPLAADHAGAGVAADARPRPDGRRSPSGRACPAGGEPSRTNAPRGERRHRPSCRWRPWSGCRRHRGGWRGTAAPRC